MNQRSIASVTAGLISLWATAAGADGARNYISIVGSTTVQPFSQAVAEQIAKTYKVKAPMIESTGTGGGITLFCEGVGMAYPDIVNASRPMKQKELDNCRANGVNDVVEIKVGSGGVTLIQSNSAATFEITRKDLFLALAKRIPDPACKTPCEKLINNPYQTWKQINPTLPDQPIEVLGPPASSGTSEAFMDTVMDTGCDSYPWLLQKKTKSETEYKRICHSLRDDGAYTEETSDSILSRIGGQSKAVGIVPYAAYQSADSHVKAVAVEGIKPSSAQLAAQTYPLTKPLLFYVKKAHVDRVPGLNRYIAEFTSDKAWGSKGYLLKKGLVPMAAAERAGYAAIARDLKPMSVAGDLLPIPASAAAELQEASKATPAASRPAAKKKKRQK